MITGRPLFAARPGPHPSPSDSPSGRVRGAISGNVIVMTAVGDLILQRLREWDVEHVFAYPGDGINGLLTAWGRADDDPRFIQMRHEEMAAFAAVGYAKFTGR